MPTTDPRVDAYIEKAEPFARPILAHLRRIVHDAAPEIEEAIKWGFPCFVRKGIVCSMASFTNHCVFGFWKAELVFGPGERPDGEAMGDFGRITSVDELPPREVLEGYVRKAVELNVKGVKVPGGGGRKRPKPGEIELPDAFRAALDRAPGAKAVFEGMPPGRRREYAEWIAEAKREATRDRRIATALEWIAEGKSRNWKYERKGGE
jgi:uncharacterized protein YdeI (YjbR/CyaY-like superfamily)